MQRIFSTNLTSAQPTATRLFESGLASGHMAHAFLLTGRDKRAKWQMARQLATFLNCEAMNREGDGQDAGGKACLQPEHDVEHVELEVIDEPAFNSACQNCKWLYRDTHPKAWYVLSSQGSKSGKIPVQRARELSEELALTTSYKRVVVIEDASEGSFHRPAANALLKTIEEPRSPSLFLFFAAAVDDVLATIVSRCQVVPLLNRPEENLGILIDVPLTGKAQSTGNWLTSESAAILARQSFLEGSSGTKAHGAQQVEESLAFAQVLLTLINEAEDSEDSEDEADNGAHVFDTALALEIKRLTSNPRPLALERRTRYLSELLRLTEEAKRRVDQYVSKKSVCESFVLSWLQLRQKNHI